jgi:hypothetical protein
MLEEACFHYIYRRTWQQVTAQVRAPDKFPNFPFLTGLFFLQDWSIIDSRGTESGKGWKDETEWEMVDL